MTRDDILRMAKEAGAFFDGDNSVYDMPEHCFERFAALVAAAERERIEELEKITGDMADAAIELHEKYEESQSADVKAMNEAQIVLQTIKDIDPGVYDEMIDNALRLIADALNIVAEEEVK